MVGETAGLPYWEISRLCPVCENEVPDEHFVVSHLLTPLTLAVCYECFSRRDTWDDLAGAYFFDHVICWQDLLQREFGEDGPPGL